jgi:hypothetical protein
VLLLLLVVLVLLLAAFIIYKPLPREPAMLTIAHTPQFPSFPLVPVAAGCGGGGMRQQQWLCNTSADTHNSSDCDRPHGIMCLSRRQRPRPPVA